MLLCLLCYVIFIYLFIYLLFLGPVNQVQVSLLPEQVFLLLLTSNCQLLTMTASPCGCPNWREKYEPERGISWGLLKNCSSSVQQAGLNYLAPKKGSEAPAVHPHVGGFMPWNLIALERSGHSAYRGWLFDHWDGWKLYINYYLIIT